MTRCVDSVAMPLPGRIVSFNQCSIVTPRVYQPYRFGVETVRNPIYTICRLCNIMEGIYTLLHIVTTLPPVYFLQFTVAEEP